MGLSRHQRTVGKSQVHLTPRWILDPLGAFDLDPCAATVRPFDSRFAAAWVERMAGHDNGILLIHARTETQWFRPIWRAASAVLFLFQRVNFLQPDGNPTTILDKRTGQRRPATSGAPVALAAFGPSEAAVLARSGLRGALVRDWDRSCA